MRLHFLLPGLVSGSLLTLGLWAFFRFVPRIAPDIRAWCWRLVLLKLVISAFAVGQVTLHLLPTTQIIPVSRPRSIPSAAAMLQKTTGIDAPEALEKMRDLGPVRLAATAIHKAPPVSKSNPRLLVFVIWASGFVLIIARSLIYTLRTRRDLQTATPVTAPDILQYLTSISKRAGLRRVPLLVCLDTAQSPMVYGIGRPIIVLPGRLASCISGDVELALGHEIAHIRRGDLIWSAIAWVVRSLLFFNPVAWLADSELRASQESATDQEAVWITGASVAAYAKMLLSSMHPDRVARQSPGLAMFDSFVSSQRRLRAMQEFSQRPRWTQKWMVAVLLVAGIGCLPSYTLVRTAAAMPNRQKSSGKETAADERTSSALAGSHLEGIPSGSRTKSSTNERGRNVRGSAKGRTASILKTPPTHLSGTTGTKHLASRPSRSFRPRPDIKFVEETTAISSPESEAFKEASKAATEAYNARISKLLADQDTRIAAYRQGADEREREAEQREREGQQRKREGEQRARAALLREQVIEEHERNHYQFVEHGQRDVDARIRRDDARQQAADSYQAVLDRRQRETDQWQREFDEKSVAAMRKETQVDIAAARSQYQKRIAELAADDASRRREASGAAAYTATEAKRTATGGLHTVRTDSGLSFAIPQGFYVVRVQTSGKDSYTVVLKHKKS